MTKSLSDNMLIARPYAQALFDSAREAGFAEILMAPLDKLRLLYEEVADFRRMLHSPLMSSAQYSALCAIMEQSLNINNEQAGGLLSRFFAVLCHNKRLAILPFIVNLYEDLLLRANKERRAQIITASALSEEQQTQIKEILEEKFAAKIKLETKLDPKILGGLIVSCAGYEIDASLLNKLSKLKLALKEVR